MQRCPAINPGTEYQCSLPDGHDMESGHISTIGVAEFITWETPELIAEQQRLDDNG